MSPVMMAMNSSWLTEGGERGESRRRGRRRKKSGRERRKGRRGEERRRRGKRKGEKRRKWRWVWSHMMNHHYIKLISLTLPIMIIVKLINHCSELII